MIMLGKSRAEDTEAKSVTLKLSPTVNEEVGNTLAPYAK
jgi:hypothetical protein